MERFGLQESADSTAAVRTGGGQSKNSDDRAADGEQDLMVEKAGLHK